jgi:hypothetical protein
MNIFAYGIAKHIFSRFDRLVRSQVQLCGMKGFVSTNQLLYGEAHDYLDIVAKLDVWWSHPILRSHDCVNSTAATSC